MAVSFLCQIVIILRHLLLLSFLIGYGALQELCLTDIWVSGRSRTPIKMLKTYCAPLYKKPLVFIDLRVLHESMTQLPWIKTLTIERHFPNTLYFQIEERKPIALWCHKHKRYLVDRDGQLLTLPHIPKEFQNLYPLLGEEAFLAFPKLFSTLQKYPNILKRVTRFTWIRKRRWNILLDHSIVAKLPDHNIDAAIVRLEHVLSLDMAKVIDLRIPQRIIILPHDGEKI